MKPLLTAVAAAIFLLLPSPAFSAYVIRLHDGTQFVTDQYYEEGDLIRFKRYGGLVGIEKDRVSEIEEIENLPEEKTATAGTEVPSAVAETSIKETTQESAAGSDSEKAEEDSGPQRTGTKEQQIENVEREEAANIQAFLDEKRQIMGEMDAATSAFKAAKAAKNKEKKDHYWNELLALQKRLAVLRDRVLAEFDGQIPDWWNEG
jgi:hypothetical protein